MHWRLMLLSYGRDLTGEHLILSRGYPLRPGPGTSFSVHLQDSPIVSRSSANGRPASKSMPIAVSNAAATQFFGSYALSAKIDTTRPAPAPIHARPITRNAVGCIMSQSARPASRKSPPNVDRNSERPGTVTGSRPANAAARAGKKETQAAHGSGHGRTQNVQNVQKAHFILRCLIEETASPHEG